MSKLWGAVQNGADPIGNVWPMDAGPGGFLFPYVTVSNDTRIIQ